MMTRTLMAIPARGGSKRLPRKNVRGLGGRPMLAHTVQAAISSGLTTDVYVCTEDEEIASVAEEYGAKVHVIPETMAGDEVSSTVPCLDLYDRLIESGERFDHLFNLQPSSPLRTSEDIVDAFRTLVDSGRDYLVSVTLTDPHFFHWGMVADTGTWRMYFRDKYLMERPQLPPVFRPNGAIKLAKAAAVRSTGNFFGEPLAVHEMPEERSIHVATEFDLRCARAMIREVDDARS
jgi:CMP-N,N'-diacetyllegionaminic acid synthase